MKRRLHLLLVALFVLSTQTIFAQSEVCGTFTLELNDTYGDGWNGNDIDLSFTGGDSTYTFTSGSQATFTLTVPYQDTVEFIWQAGGSYTSECSYRILDASGTAVYSSPQGNAITAGSTQYYLYCNTLATCASPTGVAVTTGTTDAGMSWTSGASSYSYHLVEWDTAGFAAGTGDTMWVYADTAYITGLNPATQYDFKVTTICSSTDSSQTMGVSGVYTQCAALATPWTEDFDAASSGGSTNPSLPQCWEYYQGVSYAYSTYHYIYSYISNSSSNSLRFYRSSSLSYVGDTSMSLTPEIQGLDSATKQLEFYGRKGSTSYPGEVIVGLTNANGDASSLTIVDTLYMNSDSFEKYTVYLDGATSGDARVAFVSICNQTYDYMYIDDVTVTDIPPCPEPISFSLSSATRTSATLAWSSSSAAFDIEVGLMGFTQGTGTTYSSSTPSVTATGLMQNTYYDAYVRSNCTSTGDGTSSYAGPFTFKTECGPLSVPFADDFENRPSQYGSSTNPNLPDCWTYSVNANPGNSYSYATYSTFSSYSGSGYMYNRQSNVAGDTVVVSLPMIENLDTDGAVLKFWARVSSTNYKGQMAISITDSTGDYKTAAVAQNMNVTNNTYQQYSVYLDSNVVPAGAQRPAFMFYSVNGSYNYIYLDSVEVEALPSCVAYNFAENNVTDSSADLSWSYTGANSFNLEYGPTGFIQGTGTGAQAGTLVSSVTSPYSLTGLSPNTTYDYYVENACNPGTWYGPLTFTTECTGPLAAGTYTVGATGDFATLDSVASVLNVCGIGGAVTFELQAGSFAISSALGEINGSSATNTITFKGGAGADTVTVGTDAAFLLEGAKYMNFEDLYIYAPSGKAFRLNGTSDIVIDGNTIEAGQTTSSTVNAIVASASATSIFSTTVGEKNISITNNTISGGYYGIRFYGSFSAKNENITITGNTLNDVYYYGIYVYYGTDVTISENTLDNFGASFAYGIYPYQVDGLKATMNDVRDVSYGLWAYYPATTSAATISSEISNNMLQANNYGLSVYYGSGINVYHNSVRASYGLRDYSNDYSVDIRNNIFEGHTYAIYAYNSNSSKDYNIYYSSDTSGSLGYIYHNSTYYYPSTISEFALIDSNNLNSLIGNPIFLDTNDLHVIGSLANDVGDTVGITIDFDGDIRPSPVSSTVDIGADEFDLQCLTMVGGSSDLDVCQSNDNFVWIEVLGDNVQYMWYQDGQLISNANDDTLILSNAVFDSEFKAVASASCIIGGQTITTTDSLTIQVNSKALTEIALASSLLDVVCEGENVDFGFGVTGEQLLFSWSRDGVSVGTDSLLSISSADTSESGFYQLITSGTCGTDTSQSVQLIVHPETRALTSVADTAICQDASISIPVSTDGFNVTYKWYQDGSLISTASNLSISNALSDDNGEYVLALDGYCGTDSLDAFDVLVMPTTEVIASLGDTTMCLDDVHTLAVIDTGFMNTYQWYKDGSLLSGETDSTLSLSAIAATDTGSYILVATGSCGTDTSGVIELGTWKTTTMVSESNSFDICKGDQATMFLEADGDFLSYSWTKDGFTLPGSTDDTLVLNNVQPAFAGYFIGTATGICGTATTDTITMSVHQVPNVVQEPVSDTLCQFDSTALTVAANGFGVSYDWYFNGSMIGSGATLSLDSITYAEQGDYLAVADGFCGIDSSQIAYVKVNAILPVTTAPSTSFEICELDTVPLNASSLLGQTVNVDWYRDSVLVASGATYNLIDSGMYHVVLTDVSTGCVESTPQIEVIERPVPKPIQIFGEDTIANSNPEWYWVQNEPNVDYNWSIPTGVVTAGWFSDSVEIKFSGSGTHMVYMQAENQYECTTDLELMVVVSGIGIHEGEKVIWNLYPNPTTGWAVLEFQEPLTADVTMNIVDIKGATISSTLIERGAIDHKVDLSLLEGGQYLIVLPELGMSIPIVKAD